MTDEELARLADALAERMAARVVDEMLDRLASRPANDTRVRERRRYHVPAREVDQAAIEEARAERRRRGVR
jgi:hypothetical protein